MYAEVWSHIRAVAPQTMLGKVVSTLRSKLLQHEADALYCDDPVPPTFKRNSAHLLTKSRAYQSSLEFIYGTNFMKSTVIIQVDGSQIIRVVLSSEAFSPPLCGSYFTNGDGFPCWHGVAVICEKYSSMNIYNFIDKRHLTETWKLQYGDVSYPLPERQDVDSFIFEAHRKVFRNENIQVPKALTPARVRPVKNSGVRCMDWCEKGPSAKWKRSYSGSICHSTGQHAQTCSLRQVFDDDDHNANFL